MGKDCFLGKDIFISYIEEDKKAGEHIWDRLKALRAEPWGYTKNTDGNRWKSEIVNVISKSQVMVLVFSKAANQKADKQIAKELGLATETGSEIIPFFIDEFDSPNEITNGDIKYDLSNINWIKKVTPIDRQIDILIERLERIYRCEGEKVIPSKENPPPPSPLQDIPYIKIILVLGTIIAFLLGVWFIVERSPREPFVCYESKTEVEGKTFYRGCFLSEKNCENQKKEHFGSYPSTKEVQDALQRCIKGKPRSIHKIRDVKTRESEIREGTTYIAKLSKNNHFNSSGKKFSKDIKPRKEDVSPNSLSTFLFEYVSSGNTDVQLEENIKKYFLPKVQPYYKIPSASWQDIIEEKKVYFQRWPQRYFEMKKYMIVNQKEHNKKQYMEIVLEIDWEVASPERARRNGHSTVDLLVIEDGSNYKIAGIQNLDIQRNKFSKNYIMSEYTRNISKPQQGTADNKVQNFLTQFYQASEENDLRQYMAYFADRLDTYFDRKDVSKEETIKDTEAYYKLRPWRRFFISNVILLNSSSKNIEVEVSMDWYAAAKNGKKLSGETVQKLSLMPYRESFLIDGIETIKSRRREYDNSKGKYVCYKDKKLTGNNKQIYIGCRVSEAECSKRDLSKFGRYDNNDLANRALERCMFSQPRYLQVESSSDINYAVVYNLFGDDSFLALRAQPDKDSGKIAELYSGDKVQILKKHSKWYKVKTLKGSYVGWAHSRWLKEVR